MTLISKSLHIKKVHHLERNFNLLEISGGPGETSLLIANMYIPPKDPYDLSHRIGLCIENVLKLTEDCNMVVCGDLNDKGKAVLSQYLQKFKKVWSKKGRAGIDIIGIHPSSSEGRVQEVLNSNSDHSLMLG
jgi:hypothetical protein